MGRAPGAAGEIGGEDRARERDVGDGFPERVGDDRRLDPAGERSAVAAVVAQLEPAGVAHRLGEALRCACASSRSATVRGPSSRASWRAVRRSSACSGVSRVSMRMGENRY